MSDCGLAGIRPASSSASSWASSWRCAWPSPAASSSGRASSARRRPWGMRWRSAGIGTPCRSCPTQHNGRTMMLNRRHILALGAAAGAAGFPGLARAQARAMTFCSWGGALSEFEKTTILDPFAKTKVIEIVHASPTNYAKLKAMVESGHPEWDLVDVGGRFIFQGADLLEPLDMSLIPNAKTLDPGWVTPKGIFTSTGATVVAWNTKDFAEGKGPNSWKDFWNVKTFPGPRGLYKPMLYNYEA